MKCIDLHLHLDGGVVAIDLAGAEALFPTKDYKDLFARAKNTVCLSRSTPEKPTALKASNRN